VTDRTWDFDSPEEFAGWCRVGFDSWTPRLPDDAAAEAFVAAVLDTYEQVTGSRRRLAVHAAARPAGAGRVRSSVCREVGMAYDVIVVGGRLRGLRRRRPAEREPRLLGAAAGGGGRTSRAGQDLPETSPTRPSRPWTTTGAFVSEPGGLGRAIPLPRARLVGGCSATNAAFLLRGRPADYDGWAAAGNPGWSFDELLPTFRAVEADPVGGEWHGRSGPIPVWRPSGPS
jgi:hypothetical protein